MTARFVLLMSVFLPLCALAEGASFRLVPATVDEVRAARDRVLEKSPKVCTKAFGCEESDFASVGEVIAGGKDTMVMCATLNDTQAMGALRFANRDDETPQAKIALRNACREWQSTHLRWSGGLNGLFPVGSASAAAVFYGSDGLTLFDDVSFSGWADRLAASVNLASDNFAWGRLSLRAALATATSEPSGSDENESEGKPKDNIQKLAAQGGDVVVVAEVPVYYRQKRSGSDGALLVNFEVRGIFSAPQLGSTVKDASFALEPLLRMNGTLAGLGRAVDVYGEVTAGYFLGTSSFQQYVGFVENPGETMFFMGTVEAGFKFHEKLRLGASYILVGPLRGDNGITVNLSVLTGR